jgi:outer membrane protein
MVAMRYFHRFFGFALIAILQAVFACGAGAAELAPLAPLPPMTYKIAQGSVSAPQQPLARLLARAKALSAAGKFADAYVLLALEEDTYIGVIEFDYALGRAALDARRPDKATLAFSRVLALDPKHAGAMIDIGRAYLALGNFEQARVTFELLLDLNPPPAVRTQLQGYLEQARQARVAPPAGEDLSPRPRSLSTRGYLAATVGHSTNVNLSPGQSQVFIPVFGAIYQLSSQNVAKADGFAGVSGGVDATLPLNNTYSLIGGGEFAQRKNSHESDFDLGGLGARIGFTAATPTQLLRVQLFGAREYQGGSPSRDMNALGVDYFRSVGADTTFLAFGQGGKMRYVPESIKIYDANFVTLGVGASRKFAEESTGFVTISTGYQNDVGGNPSGDKRPLGLRVGGDASIMPRLRLMGSAGWEQGHYNGFDPSFLTERRDIRTNYEIALQYALGQRTFVGLGFAQTNQRSNIEIYEYDRKESSITVRHEFR